MGESAILFWFGLFLDGIPCVEETFSMQALQEQRLPARVAVCLKALHATCDAGRKIKPGKPGAEHP